MNLTINTLRAIYDSIKRVLYVHPDDLTQPFVEVFKQNRYEIVSRDSMIKGKGFFQNAAIAGVIDFEKGEAYVGKNMIADWMLPEIHPNDAQTEKSEETES